MQLDLNPLELAPDWYAIRLANTSDRIYVNVQRQEFSVAPVVCLKQLKSTMVSGGLDNGLKAGLSMRVNSQDLQRRINKLESEIKNKVGLEMIKQITDPALLVAKQQAE
jgi:hypothetical protein